MFGIEKVFKNLKVYIQSLFHRFDIEYQFKDQYISKHLKLPIFHNVTLNAGTVGTNIYTFFRVATIVHVKSIIFPVDQVYNLSHFLNPILNPLSQQARPSALI